MYLHCRCTSRKTKEVFAAKKIQKGSLNDQQAIDDVVREVQILKVLKGRPNNVEFFGAFEDDKEVTIVLECATCFSSVGSTNTRMDCDGYMFHTNIS
jgi:serine/threonine protein kinase